MFPSSLILGRIWVCLVFPATPGGFRVFHASLGSDTPKRARCAASWATMPRSLSRTGLGARLPLVLASVFVPDAFVLFLLFHLLRLLWFLCRVFFFCICSFGVSVCVLILFCLCLCVCFFFFCAVFFIIIFSFDPTSRLPSNWSFELVVWDLKPWFL